MEKEYRDNRSYTTWYEFKKDLEKRLGHSLLNWNWLAVKPEAPLPWDDSHMHVALSVLARLAGDKDAQKRPRNRRLSTANGRFLPARRVMMTDIRTRPDEKRAMASQD
jgi:hypothetical protein